MTLLTFNTDYSEDWFQREIAQPVKKKFPLVELVYRREYPSLNDCMDKWRMSGTAPDLHLLGSGEIGCLIEEQGCLDIGDLHPAFDPVRFENGLLRYGRGMEGELFTLPFHNAMEYPLYYNKDIFDDLGLNYPEDGMSWSQTIALATQIAERGCGRYYAFDIADLALMRMQLSAGYIDPGTRKPAIQNDKWRRIAETVKQVYSIDGNLLPRTKRSLGFTNFFVKERMLAMGIVCASCHSESEFDFNWDVVSYPVHEDRCGPNLPSSKLLAIGSACSQVESAIAVAAFLVSKPYQIGIGKKGVLPALNDTDVLMYYGEQVPLYRSKNRRAFTFNRPAEPCESTTVLRKLERQINASSHVRRRFTDMIYSGISVADTIQLIDDDFNEAMMRIVE
jgi:multiple sugar transport system substrate-binding protein